MDSPVLVLIHSPLVGPLTWRACEAALSRLGRTALVPTLAGVMDDEPPWIPKLAHRVAGCIRACGSRRSVVLFAHSGAGSLIPAVIHAVGAPVAGAVFVDAVLPKPGRRRFDSMPVELREHLRSLTRDGWLPPWHEWFAPEDIASHVPDEDLRARFVAELPRLPLAFFEEDEPVVEGWESVPCGYVQLSGAYDEEAREAAARGWPTLYEPSDHVMMLTRPERMAAVLDHMLGMLKLTIPP